MHGSVFLFFPRLKMDSLLTRLFGAFGGSRMNKSLQEIEMLKFNTAKLIRVVENIDNTMPMEDIVLAMLDDDKVVISTMTLTVSNQPLITEALTSPEWGYHINEDYEGWTIQELSNK